MGGVAGYCTQYLQCSFLAVQAPLCPAFNFLPATSPPPHCPPPRTPLPATLLPHNILCRESPTQLLANQANPSISPRDYDPEISIATTKTPRQTRRRPNAAPPLFPHLADLVTRSISNLQLPLPSFFFLGPSSCTCARTPASPTRSRCQQRTLPTRWPTSATRMSAR